MTRRLLYSGEVAKPNSTKTAMERRNTATIRMYMRLMVFLSRNTVMCSATAKAAKTSSMVQFCSK